MPSPPFLPVGKLPADLLARLLARHSPSDPRVLVGPGVGRDAAIIDFVAGSAGSDRCLVAKTDPVTFATDEIGRYVVNVNANDIACCGAVPRWFLVTLLLPGDRTDAALAEVIFEQIATACAELDVALCGGHTEITWGLDRPVAVGLMLGEVARDRYLTAAGARAGDALILTKGIAIEGTALLVREKRAALGGVLAPAELDRCAEWLRDPGISVVRDAHIAVEAGGVHALHDPTEGGVATGLLELAQASGTGLLVERARLPVLPECAAVCRALGIDPLGLIGSGALLIAADPAAAPAIIERLDVAGIRAARVGEVRPSGSGCRLREADGSTVPLPVFPRDEIARLFE